MTTAVVGGNHQEVDMSVLHKINNPEQHHPEGSGGGEPHSPDTSERERDRSAGEEESGEKGAFAFSNFESLLLQQSTSCYRFIHD